MKEKIGKAIAVGSFFGLVAKSGPKQGLVMLFFCFIFAGFIYDAFFERNSFLFHVLYSVSLPLTLDSQISMYHNMILSCSTFVVCAMLLYCMICLYNLSYIDDVLQSCTVLYTVLYYPPYCTVLSCILH